MTSGFPRPMLVLACTLAIVTGCQQDAVRPELAAQFAKGGGGGKGGSTGPAVTAIEPSYGHQGETEDVTISGSGFVSGAEAIWAQGDTVAYPKIHVLSTRFVSSSQLVATVAIDTDAEIAYYDVVVTNPDRKKGIATESFEVTTAVVISPACQNSTAAGRGVNDAGQIVGNNCGDGFYWQEGSAVVDLGSGVARRIDEAGNVAIGDVGTVAGGGSGAYVWTRSSGGQWTRTILTNGASAFGLASDATGNAAIIGGSYQIAVSKRSSVERPSLWTASTGGWQFTALPVPASVSSSSSIRVYDINAAGQAVGGGIPYPIIWEPSASGYSATLLPGSGGARAISADGNLIVGLYGLTTDSRAAYWVRSNGVWTGPFFLAPDCGTTYASQVNANGIVVGKGCDGAHVWKIENGVVTVSMTLPGLGNRLQQGQGSAWGVNNAQPARVVGMPGVQIPVYWDLPF